MSLGLAAACAALWLTTPLVAQDSAPTINPDAEYEYTVKQGDTLWDIAAYYLRDPWLWPELWNANPQVENPHLIYPGEVLYLVWVDGQPRLQREPPRLSGEGERFVRLSPRVRTTPLEPAIPTIPLDAIRSFLRGPRLISRSAYEDAPYVIAFGDERLLGADVVETYVRHASEENGFRYGVVRLGQVYRDPVTDRELGYEALPIGVAEIQKFGPVARAEMTESYRETRKGDRLLPLRADDFAGNFFPHAPEMPVDGQIIAVFDGVSQIGQYQIVTLNRGSNDGLEAGHVLRVMQTGAVVDDPEIWSSGESTVQRRYAKRITRDREKEPAPGKIQLPDEDAGLLMVFKTYEGISYGLIMRATRAIHVKDKVTNPVPSS